MTDDYRDELRAAEAAVPLPLVDIANPSTHGWLRRPELDYSGAPAWEQPDGTIVGVRDPRERT